MDLKVAVSFTELIAFWGAITGTVSIVVAYFTYNRDSIKITIKAKKDWFAVGVPGYSSDESLVIVEVCNKGRRPVTITMVAYSFLTKSGSIILPSFESRELLEGKSTRYLIKQNEVDDFSEISYFSVYDAIGNSYKDYIAPFYKRLYYGLLFFLHLKKREQPNRDKV